jgi:hypothetical protein
MELKDWLNSINKTKKNLIDLDLSIEKEYPAYIVNRCLSGHVDSIMFVNEMNKYHFLSKKMRYDFLLNSLRKRKRFSPTIPKDKIEDLEYVKKYYGYSNEKAKQALKILTKEQLIFIKSKFEIGGTNGHS